MKKIKIILVIAATFLLAGCTRREVREVGKDSVLVQSNAEGVDTAESNIDVDGKDSETSTVAGESSNAADGIGDNVDSTDNDADGTGDNVDSTDNAADGIGGNEDSTDNAADGIGSNADSSNTGDVDNAGSIDNTETEHVIPEPLPVDGQDWGLSYGEAGTQPRGNVPVDILAQYDAYSMGDAEEKVIYLTFDCGYENGNTEPILDALKKHEVSATFFVVGHFLETAPELVNRMVEDGHTVGSHTYNHVNVTKLSDKQAFQEEMDAVRDKFKEVTGEELSMYYRPPEGKCYSENLLMAKELGYSTIFWSLAHVDWDPENQPSRKNAIEKLTERVHPGAIVLLHNTSQTNGEILDDLLTEWEEMGYTVRPLSDLTEE